MKLIYPLANCTVTQGFGLNANESYKEGGLKGHTAIDLVSTYDAPIMASVTAEVYSLMNNNNPDPMKYRAVFQIYDDIDYSYEVSYGHCNKLIAVEGHVYQQGDVIATVGNTGTCYVGGRLITREEKLNGSHDGHHCHFQVRKCIRVTKRNKGKVYLRNSEGLLKRNNFFYEVVNYENGYNGCCDPAPFIKTRPEHVFSKNLSYGDDDLDVKYLQECLKSYGTFTLEDTSTHYGEETRKAVLAFQLKEKLGNPLTLWWYKGKYCHEATRKRLNELYA